MFPFYIFTIFICEHAIISSPSHFRFTSMIQMCHMFKLYLTDLTGTSHSQLQPYYGDRDQPELVGTPGWSVPETAKARSCSRGNPEFSNFFKLFWNLMKFTEISLVPWHSLTSIFLAFYLFIYSFQGKSSENREGDESHNKSTMKTENTTSVVLTLLTETFRTCLSTNCLRCVQATLWAMQSFGQWLERPRNIWVAQLAPLAPLVPWPFCWSVAFPWCCWRSWDAKPRKQPKNKYNNTDINRKGMFYTERYVIPTRHTERRERVHGSPGWRVVQIRGEFGCFLSFDRLCPCWPSGEQAVGRWFYAASIHYMSKGQQF